MLLESAGKRLERVLTGNNNTGINDPGKSVRRWLGTSSGVAKQATLNDVGIAAQSLLPTTCAGREYLIPYITTPPPLKEESDSGVLEGVSDELEAWFLSLAVRCLVSDEQYQEAWKLIQMSIHNVIRDQKTKPSMHPLTARLYRYYGWVSEKAGQNLDRTLLMDAHREASLRRDVDTSATILILLLRHLLQNHQVEEANKLLSNCTFPSNKVVSNNLYCRYLYYSGWIQALRLEYTMAFGNLSQCWRKAPTQVLGFRIATQRLLVIVQLLMGDVPERSSFTHKGMVSALKPYRQITQAVRRGDLAVFQDTVSSYQTQLQQDGTYTLISRLAHSVVKAGLRQLNVSYSRISLQDVATRLGLSNATSAEFVVAKAIKDGVMDATIDHVNGYIQSHDLTNVYATTEPTYAFHRRIAYCLTTHNDAVRAMKYPPNAYKQHLLQQQSHDNKTDEEKAQELEEELDEDY